MQLIRIECIPYKNKSHKVQLIKKYTGISKIVVCHGYLYITRYSNDGGRNN